MCPQGVTDRSGPITMFSSAGTLDSHSSSSALKQRMQFEVEVENIMGVDDAVDVDGMATALVDVDADVDWMATTIDVDVDVDGRASAISTFFPNKTQLCQKFRKFL